MKISKLINLSRISDEISNINSKELSNITKIRMKIFEKQKKYDEMKNLSLILIDGYYFFQIDLEGKKNSLVTFNNFRLLSSSCFGSPSKLSRH